MLQLLAVPCGTATGARAPSLPRGPPAAAACAPSLFRQTRSAARRRLQRVGASGSAGEVVHMVSAALLVRPHSSQPAARTAAYCGPTLDRNRASKLAYSPSVISSRSWLAAGSRPRCSAASSKSDRPSRLSAPAAAAGCCRRVGGRGGDVWQGQGAPRQHGAKRLQWRLQVHCCSWVLPEAGCNKASRMTSCITT